MAVYVYHTCIWHIKGYMCLPIDWLAPRFDVSGHKVDGPILSSGANY